MFDQLTQKFNSIVDKLKGKATLNTSNIEEALRQIRLNLLEADVNFKVVKEFCEGVKVKALGEAVQKSLSPHQQFIKIFHEELVRMMGETASLNLSFKPPVVVMLVGLQGSGKTTTAAKLALHLKKQRHRLPYLVPADIYRPAAIAQLKTLSERISVSIYPTDPKQDPVKVAQLALREATDKGYDTVIIDTAGRLQMDEPMMKELEKIKAKINPQHILLVVDAMTGQEAVNIAGAFHARLGLSGLILSKLDGDARGGAALSARYVTGQPIYFAGVGEKIEDLEPFYPDRIANRILGMGDMLTLIEKVQAEVDVQEAETMSRKFLQADFNLEDFLAQLKQIKKLGPLGKIMGMVPGLGKLKDKVDPEEMQKELKKKEAIILSMTPKERRFIKLFNGSRRKRVALGSGTQVSDVNRLIKEYEQMREMMGKMRKMGMMRGIKDLLQRG
ncbi:MAG: signal recognition particle protein [Deltaproteobacteria bacterium]|nr:signal recognition particle protein [Deltaproteobacteria bacterium]